jgi:hypothetical protein
VQPYSYRPFTKIEGDSWRSQIHLGTEYAALLVDPGYTPPDTTESLPVVGAGVAAVAVVRGQGPTPTIAAPKILQFSGYEWTVRRAASFRSRSRNSFDPSNAWIDESGALHLRIAKNQSGWTSAEVRLTRSLGYGTYEFTVRDISHMEPSAVLTFFTWDDAGTEEYRRELDVEISKWGDPNNNNTHYVVQPYYIPNNVIRFPAPPGVLTHSFHWEPDQVTFTTVTGFPGAPGSHMIRQHVFTSGIPPASSDAVHINLYVFAKGPIPVSNETEVVIEKFEYLP